MVERLSPRLVTIGDLLESLARGVLALRLDRDRCSAEIFEQRIHPLLKQRQPMLHPGMTAALAHRLVHGIVALRRAEGCHIPHAKAPDSLGNELELRNRDQIERAHVEKGALGFRIKRADRFQTVAEKIETDGLVQPCREQIEDAAAHSVFAGLPNGRRAIVAVVLQPRHDGIHRHDLTGRHRECLRRDRFARRHPLHDRIHGRQHNQRLLAAGKPGQARQCGQPLRQDAAMRRHPIVGLAVPSRKLQNRQVGREEFKRAGQLLHPRTIPANDGKAHSRRFGSSRHRAREVRNHQTFRALGDIGERQRPAWRQQFGRRSCWLLHAS